MAIREDAGRLLKYIYDQYVGGNEDIGSQLVYDHFVDWGDERAGRINRAIDYLRDLYTIKITLFIGNYNDVYNFQITGLTDVGVTIIEEEGEFRTKFGIDLPA